MRDSQYQQHLPGMTGPGGLPPPQHQPRGSGQPMGQGPNQQQQQQQHPSMPPPAAAALPPQRQLSRSELSGGDGVSPSGSSVVSRKNSSEDNKENSHSSGGGSRGDRAGSIESTTATGLVNDPGIYIHDVDGNFKVDFDSTRLRLGGRDVIPSPTQAERHPCNFS